jgi:hypothetical protein
VKLIVLVATAVVFPPAASVIVSFTFSLWWVVRSRLPVLLRLILIVLLWPAESVTVAVPTTTMRFFVFCLRAVIATTVPPLTVSVTVSVTVILQVPPDPPVQLTRTLADVPDTLVRPTATVTAVAGASWTTAVCAELAGWPAPAEFDAVSTRRMV